MAASRVQVVPAFHSNKLCGLPGKPERGLINILQQTDNDCSHSNVSTFHTQFGAQTCFAKFTSRLRRLSLSTGENKPKDGREALADEMFQNVQQSYLLHSWRKWLPVPNAEWVHSFNWVSRRENRTDTSDKSKFQRMS